MIILMKCHLWRPFGENKMSRKLIQMTNTIFSEIASGVLDEHKEFITNVKRQIFIDETYKECCCEFLKKAHIIGINKKNSLVIVFIEYDGQEFIGIDSRYAEIFERYDYILEEEPSIIVGCQLLSIAEKFYQLKAESNQIINNCLGLEPESGNDSVVFSAGDIIDLIYGVSVFKLKNNELELCMQSREDLMRVLLILVVNANAELIEECKDLLSALAAKAVTRKICNNLLDFMYIKDNRIKFLTLYQCIEFLFIPNQAYEFKVKYNMDITEALKLHINESLKRDERGKVMAVLKNYASESIVQKIFVEVCGDKEKDNKLEQVKDWIYNLRCSIAHLRYGQIKDEPINNWDNIFVLMLELLNSIYDNINQDVQDICKGSVII